MLPRAAGAPHAALLAVALAVTACTTPAPRAGAAPESSAIPTRELDAHLRFLASDLLEGRGIGTRGGALGVEYVESVFRAAGLQPGFAGSYRQSVPLRAYAADPAARIELGGDDPRELRPGDDFVGVSFGLPNEGLRGEPLFVGYAIQAPTEPWDDFKGIDVRGRLLVAFTNEPGRTPPIRFGGRALTIHGRWRTKFELAAKLGASGMLLIHTDNDAGYGWPVVRAGWTGESFRLASDTHALPFQGWLSEARAKELAARAGTTLEALRAQAERPDFKPFPLHVPTRLTAATRTREVSGTNVVAIASGASDRAVLLTAHHDHLGRGEPVDGDDIYNGALDNGAAVALLLGLATHYGHASSGAHPPIVFAAVDAEEEGLLGATCYAEHPAWPLAKTSADLNLELSNVWGRTRDVQAIGAELSELDDVFATVLPRLDLRRTPDAAPEQGFFFRSDQFALAEAGVPGVWLSGGVDYVGRPAGWGEARYEDFRAHRYHRPGDELQPDWDLSGLAQLGDVVIALVDELGRRPMPAWKKGDYQRAPTPRAP